MCYIMHHVLVYIFCNSNYETLIHLLLLSNLPLWSVLSYCVEGDKGYGWETDYVVSMYPPLLIQSILLIGFWNP